jgi:hypothetical protein
MDVALGDLNDDGTLDVVLACRDGSIVVRLGLGEGTLDRRARTNLASGPLVSEWPTSTTTTSSTSRLRTTAAAACRCF